MDDKEKNHKKNEERPPYKWDSELKEVTEEVKKIIEKEEKRNDRAAEE